MPIALPVNPALILRYTFPAAYLAFKVIEAAKARMVEQAAAGADEVTPDSAETTLPEGVRWFQAGQTAVRYADVLVPYLVDADEVVIYDRYVRHWHQMRNLMELLEDLGRARSGQALTVRLVTAAARGPEDVVLAQSQMLSELQEVAARDGIRFTVTFDEAHHDRWIEAGDWTILLGKGLDFWRPSHREQGHLNPGQRRQDVRAIAQTFAVTYLRSAA